MLQLPFSEAVFRCHLRCRFVTDHNVQCGLGLRDGLLQNVAVAVVAFPELLLIYHLKLLLYQSYFFLSATTQLNSDLNNRIEFTITSIDSKYAFTGNSYKHNGKVYINGYFHCNSPSVGITTCFFVPEGFRPKIKCGSACYTDDDVNFNNIGAVKIDTNGDITIYFPTVYSTCVYTSIVYDID